MRNLDTLPFDVLFEVSRYLALDDVAALGCASRRLRGVVKGEDALCRMVVQVSFLLKDASTAALKAGRFGSISFCRSS
ncbi:hypothetical protein BC567DRAFT_221333 [Phyllosticta citribraziliensis]